MLQPSEIIVLANAGAPESVSGLEHCDLVLFAIDLGVAEVQAFQRGAYGSAQLGGRSSGLAHTHLLDQL